jgi:hypothetical protein
MQISFAIVPFRPAASACWDPRQGWMERCRSGRKGDARKGYPVSRWCAGCLARACPEGRRAVAKVLQNKLYDTETHLQRVCGQPLRGPRRRIIVAGVEPGRGTRRGRSTADIRTAAPRDGAGESLLHAFGATCTPPTVFPSLRAHEPNPAWPAIHPDLAGDMFETKSLEDRTFPGDTRGEPASPGPDQPARSPLS